MKVQPQQHMKNTGLKRLWRETETSHHVAHFVSLKKALKRLLVKVCPSCNEDSSILEMSVAWDNYQEQKQPWSGACLGLENKLCVLQRPEPETCCRQGLWSPEDCESQKPDTVGLWFCLCPTSSLLEQESI